MVDGEERMRRVTAIRNGTVIDHIPSGHAVTVLEILGISGRRVNPVSMVMNVPSGKMEHKDIIKIEDRELDQHELDRLALVAPDASVSIIREYRVAEKLQIRLGEEIVNVARCSYRNCATNGPASRCPIDWWSWGGIHFDCAVITACARKASRTSSIILCDPTPHLTRTTNRGATAHRTTLRTRHGVRSRWGVFDHRSEAVDESHQPMPCPWNLGFHLCDP